MTSPLAALAAMIGLILLGFAAWLMHAEARRLVTARVREVGGAPPPPEAPRAVPKLGLPDKTEGRLTPLFRRIFAYNPDLPQAMIVPWPVLVPIGIGSLFLGWQLVKYIAGARLAIIGGPLLSVMAVRATLKWQYNRYAKLLYVQLPDALGLIQRAISAGVPINEAIHNVARAMPQPTSEQFTQIVGEAGIGYPLDQAFLRLYDRSGVTEYAFFAVTLGLQSQTGGSLAETLENLADTIRKRVGMEGRAKALAAESRMSAMIVTALPFVAAVAMSFIHPGFLTFFWVNPTGFKMLVSGLCLLALGSLTIRWMINGATSE
jgi:tight adherence protein B